METFSCIITILALYIIGLSEIKGLSEDKFIRTPVGVIDLNHQVTKDTEKAVNVKTSGEGHSRVRRSTGFSEAESQAILDKHNALRSQVSPEASDMQFMIWDDDLATMAQQWSDMCNFNHGQPSNISPYSTIGQNLYQTSGGPDNRANGVAATQAWYNEYQFYTYETKECQTNRVCGHYTQIVWADSHALGCGLSYCSSTTDGATNVWIITCNYGPSYVPFVNWAYGCTECPSGARQCYNNQCRSCSVHNETCTCNLQCRNCGTLDYENCTCTCQQGYVGNDCSGICEDISSYCNAGWYFAQCFTHGFVLNGCPKMCGTCNTNTVTTTTVPQTTEGQKGRTESTTIKPTSVRPTTWDGETTEIECRLHCLYGVCSIDEDGNAFCKCSTRFSGPTCKRVLVYCPCEQNPK
ncbi:peptidase inhibitor 15-A-like [Anneissia japonica]|uniref:peptidase inhibitor 15-A-like n=1 Tax=Anneissia japonica TaxID=1529436 RepID=UPI00142564FF|nr:peptidase inhibitor 15-A-like [Anneissia japonica]